MAVVSVTTTLTTLASALDRAAEKTRVDVYAYAPMFVGTSSTLTADTAATGGTPLAAGQGWWTILERGGAVYGRTASGTASAVIEQGVAG